MKPIFVEIDFPAGKRLVGDLIVIWDSGIDWENAKPPTHESEIYHLCVQVKWDARLQVGGIKGSSSLPVGPMCCKISI